MTRAYSQSEILSTITTNGDILLGSGAGTISRLGIGTNGYALVSNGTTASWAIPTDTSKIPLATVTTAGDLIIGTGSSTVSRLGIGTSGTALVSNGTTATWTTPTDTTKIPLSTVTTAGDLIIGTGSSTVSRLGIGTNGQVLQSNGTTATWATISLAPWTSSQISANTNLVARYQYFVNTASAVTLTLPTSPSVGDEIRIFDQTGSAATNNITVSPGASNLQGSVQNLLINVAYGSCTLVYTGSTYGWKVA